MTRPPPVASADASATPPSGKTSGLSVAEFISISSTRREVVERVPDRAVDLRHAAQRVRVLDLVVAPWWPAELAVAQQAAQLGRDRDLTRMRPRQLVRRRERDVRAEQRLDAIAARRSRSASSRVRVGAAASAPTPHQLRPVEERETLLGLERERLQAGLAQRDQRRDDLTVDSTRPRPIKRQRQVRERREVTRAPTEPCSGTTGWIPARRNSSSRSTTIGRQPLCPCARAIR